MESSSLLPQDFPQFRHFPTEIRHRVWWFTARAAAPRVMKIYYHRDTGSWTADNFSSKGLPEATQVSREARIETLKCYPRVFDAHIDLEKDTIYVNDTAFGTRTATAALTSSEHVSKIQHFAVSCESYSRLAWHHTFSPRICESLPNILRSNFTGLESFTLVLGDNPHYFTDKFAPSGPDSVDEVESDEEDEKGNLDKETFLLEARLEKFVMNAGRDEDQDENHREVENREEAKTATSADNTKSKELHDLDRTQVWELQALRKWYRKPCNICFLSPIRSPMFDDLRQEARSIMRERFEAENSRHPSWSPPTISVILIGKVVGPTGSTNAPSSSSWDQNYTDCKIELQVIKDEGTRFTGGSTNDEQDDLGGW